jgi:23S rRNA (uracil1939-C5)-methyltransferase
MPQPPEQIIADIHTFAFEGFGIGELSADLNPSLASLAGIKVLIPFTYPGDRVYAAIRKRKKNYIEAKLVEILKPSEHRKTPLCKYYKSCGGCKQQDLDYPIQVQYKEQQVREIFEKLGGIISPPLDPIIPAESAFYYRNKMEYSFSDRAWIPAADFNPDEQKNISPALGLHVPQGFDKVINIDECFLQSELSNTILRFTADHFFSRGISIYNNRRDEGYLRNLVIRTSRRSSDVMVNLVTFFRDEQIIRTYKDALLNAIPEVTTIINNINSKKAMIAVGEKEHIDHGKGYIVDRIGDHSFKISANSFFQTNPAQAEKLYQTAADFAEFEGNEIVYDLYCGAGTIASFISDKVQAVYGFEAAVSAVTDAEENKQMNGIGSIHFYQADLYSSFLEKIKSENIPHPDVIILDPPRSGMHKVTVADVSNLAPKKIIYVSCNPATQVRDIKLFLDAGYKLKRLRPVDMFPHTFHIETVALLEQSAG